MKKFKLVLLILFTLFVAHSRATYAEAPSVNTYHEGTGAYDTQGNMNNPSLSRESQNNIGVFWADGILPTKELGLGANPANLVNNPDYHASLLGKVSTGITDLYIMRPAGPDMFLADLGSRFGIAPPAYAQGIGFQGLSPILPLWRVFRNIAYGFLIAVMVIIGFMVMFRMKIDPRTVISVQAALPRIITTVILITFSYAIVGLLIDLMYVVIFLVAFALNTAMPFADFGQTITNYTGGSLWTIFGAMHTAGLGGVQSIVNMLGGGSLTVIAGLIGAVVGSFMVPGVGTVIGLGAGAASPHVLVYLIVFIAILFAFLRIFFLVLNAYIQVILSLVLGPVQLMLGAIPNNNAFGGWIRNLIANLAVFPTVSSIILLAQLLTTAALRNANMWAPPGLGGGNASAVSGILGLGMALMIPGVVNTIKESLKAKPAVQSGLSPIVAPLGTMTGTGMQLLSASYYLQSPGAQGFIGKLMGRAPKPKATGGTH